MVFEQQGFYSWPHLLWQGHLWVLVTYKPVVERLTVELSLPVLWLWSVATGIWTPDLLHARQTLLWTKQQSWSAAIPVVYYSFMLINSNPGPIKWYYYKISEVLYRRKGKLLENARFWLREFSFVQITTINANYTQTIWIRPNLIRIRYFNVIQKSWIPTSNFSYIEKIINQCPKEVGA